jgi:hypothetical protein
MTTAKDISGAIHDTINESATAIEGIHRSIAALPLDVLAAIEPLEETVGEVRDLQSRAIGSVYGLVRKVNTRIGEITSEVLA